MNPTVIGLAVCAKVRSGATASSVPAPTILDASASRRRREICLVMMLSPHSALRDMPRPTIRPGSVGAVNWAGPIAQPRRAKQGCLFWPSLAIIRAGAGGRQACRQPSRGIHAAPGSLRKGARPASKRARLPAWLARQQRHGIVDNEAELGLGVARTARREDVRVARPDAQTLPALIGRLPAQGKIELLLVGQRGLGRWIDGVPAPNKKGGGGHVLETDLVEFKDGAQSRRLFAGVVACPLRQIGVVGFGSQREIDGVLIARG